MREGKCDLQDLAFKFSVRDGYFYSFLANGSWRDVHDGTFCSE
jgi:hypothetical protein